MFNPAWLDEGIEQGATHVIVVCDLFDYSDFPVFVQPTESTREEYLKWYNKPKYKVMELYNLKLDLDMQKQEYRAFHL